MLSFRSKGAALVLFICVIIFVLSTIRYGRGQSWTSLSWASQDGDEQAEAAVFIDMQQLQYKLQLAQAEAAGAEAKAAKAEVKAAKAQSAAAVAASEADRERLKSAAEDAKEAKQRQRFAYVFYATSDAYACSALVNIHSLRTTLNVSHPIHVLVSSKVSRPYTAALLSSGAKLHIEEAPPLKNAGNGSTGGYYEDCMLKLLAFKLQTIDPSLQRILAFDSDQLILRNLDHLFTGLPDVDLAAPRAYWLAKDFLASTFLMINLSDRLWKTVQDALNTAGYNKFDMDLINDLLGDQVMMLSGEYITLNSHWEDWNLPQWYHPLSKLNMTTIEMFNKLAKPGRTPGRTGGRKRQDGSVPQPHIAPLSAELLPTVSFPAPAPPAAVVPAKPSARVIHTKPSPTPRFPPEHPLTEELFRLQDAAAVIHFTAQGKPWMSTPDNVQLSRPDAHPLLAEQFKLWRKKATEVCPGGIPRAVK